MIIPTSPTENGKLVIPAKAGIQVFNILLRKAYRLDSHLRGNDG